jgi:hypothetical protein
VAVALSGSWRCGNSKARILQAGSTHTAGGGGGGAVRMVSASAALAGAGGAGWLAGVAGRLQVNLRWRRRWRRCRGGQRQAGQVLAVALQWYQQQVTAAQRLVHNLWYVVVAGLVC